MSSVEYTPFASPSIAPVKEGVNAAPDLGTGAQTELSCTSLTSKAESIGDTMPAEQLWAGYESPEKTASIKPETDEESVVVVKQQREPTIDEAIAAKLIGVSREAGRPLYKFKVSVANGFVHFPRRPRFRQNSEGLKTQEDVDAIVDLAVAFCAEIDHCLSTRVSRKR